MEQISLKLQVLTEYTQDSVSALTGHRQCDGNGGHPGGEDHAKIKKLARLEYGIRPCRGSAGEAAED